MSMLLAVVTSSLGLLSGVRPPTLSARRRCGPRTSMVVDVPRYAPTVEDEICGNRFVSGQTYAEQFEEVFSGAELRTSKPLAKPRPSVARDPGAARIPFSNVRSCSA